MRHESPLRLECQQRVQPLTEIDAQLPGDACTLQLDVQRQCGSGALGERVRQAAGNPHEGRIRAQLPAQRGCDRLVTRRGGERRAALQGEERVPLGAAFERRVRHAAAGCLERRARRDQPAAGNRQLRRAMLAPLPDHETHRAAEPLSGECRALQVTVGEGQRAAQRRQRRQARQRPQLIAIEQRREAHVRQLRRTAACVGR